MYNGDELAVAGLVLSGLLHQLRLIALIGGCN